jgi:hypothetical protein
MITVERGDELHERSDRLHFAAIDHCIREAQRFGEAGDLQMGVAVGRIEPPLRERAVDLAPDLEDVDLAPVGDLLGDEPEILIGASPDRERFSIVYACVDRARELAVDQLRANLSRDPLDGGSTIFQRLGRRRDVLVIEPAQRRPDSNESE